MTYDWAAIAARLKGLVGVNDQRSISTVAERLGVDESSLRVTLEQGSPTIDVIAALVRIYGLDPSWVLTGHYDPATHREALESNTDEIEITLHNLLSRKIISSPPNPRATA